MSILGTACGILVSLHSNFPAVSGSYVVSATGHWVTVSVSETAAMPAPWHLVALLLLCGASAWPVIRSWSNGNYDYNGILGHNNDTSRTSRGKVSKG